MPALDSKGYPILLATKVASTKSGNPFHNSATGEFSFAPAGVQILKGGELLKLLSAPSRKTLGDRIKLSGANQLAAQIIEGKLHIVLLINGKRIHSFAILPKTDAQKAKEGEGKNQAGIEITPVIKDAMIEAARNLGLEDDQIIKFIQDKTGAIIGEEQKQAILDGVQDQRIQDLVDYLDQQLKTRVEGAPQNDALVKISVGRGYLRKTFSRLDEATTKIVLDRLSGRGWNTPVIQATIVTKFPKRLKDTFEIENKKDKGKEEVESKQKKSTK